MVCCAIISLILAGLLWPFRKLIMRFRPRQTPALLWQAESVAALPPAPRFSPTARLKSFGYAASGIGFVVRNEHNARIHIVAATLVVIIGAAYQIAAQDWLILILAIVSVWFAETMNTAFEYLCDVVSPQKNESVRRAKDIAAGAVLITAVGAAIIGSIVMFPHVKAGFEVNTSSINYAALIADSLCFGR